MTKFGITPVILSNAEVLTFTYTLFILGGVSLFEESNLFFVVDNGSDSRDNKYGYRDSKAVNPG